MLLNAQWIIPVCPRDELLPDHAIAVDGGRIVEILPRTRAARKYQATTTHSLSEHTLIPGLVNAHTHAAMNLFKGLADDLRLMEWLESHIWPAEQRWVSAEFVRDGTRLAIAEMLRSGTTCFNDMYFFPDEAGKAASQAGMRAVLGLIMIDAPTVWASTTDEYFAKGTDVHDRFRGDPLISTAFAPHAPYTVSNESLERIQVLAEELDIPIHMHVHETENEVAHALRTNGLRPLKRLDQMGVLSHRLAAVHMTQLEQAEIERLAECGAHVVHCPESNLKLASGFCPVVDLLGAGVNVALGTDGAASNNDLDMVGEMRTCAYLAKGVAQAADVVPASQALAMATLGSAKALGLDGQIGSLEAGKAADIVAVDLSAIETQPSYDPLAQIVYACSRQQITDVWIAGQHVLNQRVLTTLDEDALLATARDWQKRLQ